MKSTASLTKLLLTSENEASQNEHLNQERRVAKVLSTSARRAYYVELTSEALLVAAAIGTIEDEKKSEEAPESGKCRNSRREYCTCTDETPKEPGADFPDPGNAPTLHRHRAWLAARCLSRLHRHGEPPQARPQLKHMRL